MQPVLFKHLVSSIGLGRQTSGHFDDLMKLLTHADQALSAHKFFSGVGSFVNNSTLKKFCIDILRNSYTMQSYFTSKGYKKNTNVETGKRWPGNTLSLISGSPLSREGIP